MWPATRCDFGASSACLCRTLTLPGPVGASSPLQAVSRSNVSKGVCGSLVHCVTSTFKVFVEHSQCAGVQSLMTHTRQGKSQRRLQYMHALHLVALKHKLRANKEVTRKLRSRMGRSDTHTAPPLRKGQVSAQSPGQA